MSLSANRRDALDESAPLAHRASHARSCALHVANKLGVGREEVIGYVEERTGANLRAPRDGAELVRAVAFLEALRLGHEAWRAPQSQNVR
jgi:hypothetical protein